MNRTMSPNQPIDYYSQPVIRLIDITKVYRVGSEEIRALNGVCLEIRRNEYVAVMGASGSGKSTLMNIVGCLDQPTSGIYELDGRAVSLLGAAALARVRNQRKMPSAPRSGNSISKGVPSWTQRFQ